MEAVDLRYVSLRELLLLLLHTEEYSTAVVFDEEINRERERQSEASKQRSIEASKHRKVVKVKYPGWLCHYSLPLFFRLYHSPITYTVVLLNERERSVSWRPI